MKKIKKYWYIIPILLLVWYFYPRDYLKNCINDFKGKQTYYKGKFAAQYGQIICLKIKKDDPKTFDLLKGKIFSKTSLFNKFLPH